MTRRYARTRWQYEPLVVVADVARSIANSFGLMLGSAVLWQWIVPPNQLPLPVWRGIAVGVVAPTLLALVADLLDTHMAERRAALGDDKP